MKEISGRKFSAIALISTYCFVIIGSVILTICKIMSIEVMLALISGLGTTVMYVIKAYFDDKDRSKENGKEHV
jgi:hypothetical protein